MTSANREEENIENIPAKEEMLKPQNFLSIIKTWIQKNWIFVVAIIVVVGTYISLALLKNSLQKPTGTQANFKSQAVPDFSQQNKDNENAQKSNDRVGAANNVLAQNEAKENGIVQDSANNYVRYSSANAYAKIQKQEIKPVQKADSTTIIAKIPAIILPKKETKKQISRKQTNEREQKILEIDGFNTVVLSDRKSVV